MSRDEAYLFDILASARAALEYTRGKTWVEFSSDMLLQDAVVRRLDIIWNIVEQDLPFLAEELERIISSK